LKAISLSASDVCEKRIFLTWRSGKASFFSAVSVCISYDGLASPATAVFVSSGGKCIAVPPAAVYAAYPFIGHHAA